MSKIDPAIDGIEALNPALVYVDADGDLWVRGEHGTWQTVIGNSFRIELNVASPSPAFIADFLGAFTELSLGVSLYIREQLGLEEI